MDRPGRRTILIVSSTWWAFPAKLAVAFAAIGVNVDVVCPGDHPFYRTGSVSRRFRYSAINPLKALARAIDLARPVIIIPCDDRAVGHLHALHAQCLARSPVTADLIAQSLGNPEKFGIADRRSDLIRLARRSGIRAPLMLQTATEKELVDGLRQIGLPAIMKVDGTWGGSGVRVVHTIEQAALTFVTLSRPLSLWRAIKRLLFDRDPFPLMPCLRRERPIVNIQSFVSGRPANCSVACWKGRVIGYIGAEVLNESSEFGPSAVVRIIECAEMRRAATCLVQHLGLSGFCGFDFVIDTAGAAHLVEMNARATPITHLALGAGRDLVATLSSRALGFMSLTRAPVNTSDIISFFPQILYQRPVTKLVRGSYCDVPWEDPELVCELAKRPWPERGFLAALARGARKPLGFRSRMAVLPSAMCPFEAARAAATIDDQIQGKAQ